MNKSKVKLSVNGGDGFDEFEREFEIKYYLPFCEITKGLIDYIAENYCDWFGWGTWAHIEIYCDSKYIGYIHFASYDNWYCKPTGKPIIESGPARRRSRK